MKDNSDDYEDCLYPSSWKVIYVPVFRQFSNDSVTNVRVVFGKFLYPPFLIQDIVGRPRSLMDPVPNFLYLFFGLIAFLSIFSATAYWVRRFIEVRRKRILMENIQTYFGKNSGGLKKQLKGFLPVECIYDEKDFGFGEPDLIENESPDEEDEIPIEAVVKVQTLENQDTENSDQEQRAVISPTVDNDHEILPNDLIKRNIVPSEPCERHVMTTELCEEKVENTKPSSPRHVVKKDTCEKAQPKQPVSQSPGRKPISQRKQIPSPKPVSQQRKPVVSQANKMDPNTRKPKVQGPVSRK